MTKRHYSAFHSLNQKFATTRWGSWLYARILHHLDRAFLKLTDGRTTLSRVLAGLPEVMVTTINAKSGQPSTIPLLCIREQADSETFALIASNGGETCNPAWYYNLKASPFARCSFGGPAEDYIAHEARGEEYDKLRQRAVEEYIGSPLSKQHAPERLIPIMVLYPMRPHPL
ncbi:MAG: nitroreductase family deazaflavin-dependent oxidoreductase [Chloroflexi bacterium]|nr:nitroreductase family deazaflavin-dependent oxidoreductase [Chloroflexota bacterium]